MTNFIKGGYQAKGGPKQDSLQQHAGDFNDDANLKIWILSPDEGEDPANPSGKFLYPDKIDRMASAVAGVLGVTTDRITKQTYVAVDKEKGPGSA